MLPDVSYKSMTPPEAGANIGNDQAIAQPLAGAGHDHFGFNEWEVKTCYDNVKVTPL